MLAVGMNLARMKNKVCNLKINRRKSKKSALCACQEVYQMKNKITLFHSFRHF